MKFRELEEDIFETDSEEYIRRDIEGSGLFGLSKKVSRCCLKLIGHRKTDLDTRRRGACDLVRGLCAHWEPEVTAIFTGFG